MKSDDANSRARGEKRGKGKIPDISKDTIEETYRIYPVTQDPIPEEYREVTERKPKKEK